LGGPGKEGGLRVKERGYYLDLPRTRGGKKEFFCQKALNLTQGERAGVPQEEVSC